MTLRSIRLRFSARIALLVLLSAPSAQAQWILGADTLSARAVIDSQSSLVALNAAIRNAPNDATLRHHVGLLAWALSIRARAEPAIRGLNEYVLRGLADSSLRLAVQLDPKSARYELALGRFLRASSDPMLRITGPPHVDAAVELSKAGPDAALHPRIVLESGHLHWLQYETYANQTLKESCPNLAASVGGAAGETGTAIALKVLHNDLAQCMPASGRAGADEYERAEGLFREAAGAMPDDPSAFRHLAMLLAEKGRWVELATVARGRTARLPRDGPAWLTLALAMHRNAQSQHAAGVFDTALTHLDARERGRLFAFARLLTPQDSAEFTTGNAQLRQKRERTFWEMVTPLRSRPETDPRTEFLARVAFAELRWTVEATRWRSLSACAPRRRRPACAGRCRRAWRCRSTG